MVWLMVLAIPSYVFTYREEGIFLLSVRTVVPALIIPTTTPCLAVIIVFTCRTIVTRDASTTDEVGVKTLCGLRGTHRFVNLLGAKAEVIEASMLAIDHNYEGDVTPLLVGHHRLPRIVNQTP
jgi:hypothetical protein